MALLKTIFDFDAIKALLAREDFTMVYDSMHGVQGPYAKVCLHKTTAREPSTNAVDYIVLVEAGDFPVNV